MRSKILLTLLLIFSFETIVLAQVIPPKEETPKQEVKRVKKQQYNLKQFTKETGQFVTLPLKWKSEDWFKVGFIGAGTFLFMQADEPLRNFLGGPVKDRKYLFSVPIEAGRIWGEWYTSAAIVGGAGLYRILQKSPPTETKKIGLELFQSAVYSEAITSFLKVTVGRARPYKVDSTGNYSGNIPLHPFTLNKDYNSYPSGHTTLAFALSTVLSRNVKSPVLKVLCYVPAVMTTASRIYQDKHWDSDIFTGAAIGYFTSTWVVNLHEIKKPKPVEENFSPLPSAPDVKTTPTVPLPPERKTHYGIRGGFNASKMIVNDVTTQIGRAGANIGVFAKIGFSDHFAFQPELFYSWKGANLTYDNDYVNGNVIFKLNYIDFRLLGVINVTKNTNIHGGFYLAQLVRAKTTNGSDSTSIDFAQQVSKANFSSLDYGLVFGLGVDNKKFSYGIRYNYGLSTVGKDFYFNNGETHRFPDGKFSIVQFYISCNIK